MQPWPGPRFLGNISLEYDQPRLPVHASSPPNGCHPRVQRSRRCRVIVLSPLRQRRAGHIAFRVPARAIRPISAGRAPSYGTPAWRSQHDAHVNFLPAAALPRVPRVWRSAAGAASRPPECRGVVLWIRHLCICGRGPVTRHVLQTCSPHGPPRPQQASTFPSQLDHPAPHRQPRS